jgi:hypothetical protein
MKETTARRFVPLAKKAQDRVAGYRELGADGGPWIEGYLTLGTRSIARVSTRLDRSDRLGALRVRLGFGRDRYRILPGLYAVGSPGADSPILVSANYKLSFDALRRELGGLDLWVLVIDTKGVNVWCAAGKGSFGTAELVAKLGRCRLDEIVSHRELILPQLGAAGVSGPELRRLSGFRAIWGPVRARDLPAFLAAGKKKTPSMSRVSFGLGERLLLAPIEVVHAWPYLLAALGLGLLAGLPFGPGWVARSLSVAGLLVGSVLTGAALFPALLFVLPSRSFAIKGAFLGLLWGGLLSWALHLPPGLASGLCLISSALVAWIGLNFTGSTTFTSPSGAAKEVERTMLPAAIGTGAGLVVAALSIALRF